MFSRESTGHLSARFKVSNIVYRCGTERSLRPLWNTVHVIDQLIHAVPY
jgi:hypothetical protein